MRPILLLAIVQAALASSHAGVPAAGAPSNQLQTLRFGTPVQRAIRSGEIQEYSLTAGAGDLISGPLEVHDLEAIVEIVGPSGVFVHTVYVFKDDPQTRRIGFVAPISGAYRIRFKAFDRLDGGPPWAPGELVPVVGSASGSYTLRLDDAAVSVRLPVVQPASREEHLSSRLAQLSHDLEIGRTDALQSFWREVSGNGPIVQEIVGNDREFDVTFLWREIYDTRNVLLLWCPRTEDCYMSRLPGTDVWYKTLRLRRGSRLEYSVSPNDTPQDRSMTRQLDPLNPRKFPDDPTYHFVTSSVFETTGAPDDSWAKRAPTRRGHLEEKKVQSGILGGEREIWIYTPPGYTSSAGPLPVLLLLDGAAYVSNRFLNAPATLDNLINDGRIKPVIVVFDPANRGNAAGAPRESKYSQVVVQELMPAIHAAYSISSNPADVVIGGFSAGGRAAAEVAFFHPEAFGNVLAQSGSFRMPGPDEPNINAQMFLTAPKKPIRFYLEVGVYDNVPGGEQPVHVLALDETNLMGNRHFRDVLRAKGYDVIYREVGGGHQNLHWRAMLADGLMALLGR